VNAIFNKVPSNNKIYPIDFRVEEINGKLRLLLMILDVFLGVLGKSIIELISANLEESLSSKLNAEVEKHAKEAVKSYLSRADYSIKLQDFKRCKYCTECGTELPEP